MKPNLAMPLNTNGLIVCSVWGYSQSDYNSFAGLIPATTGIDIFFIRDLRLKISL